MRAPWKILALMAVLVLAAEASAQSVSRGTYLALQDIQKLIEEERLVDARDSLEALVLKTRENPYDYALANQYLAHTSVMLDDAGRARLALEAALGSPDLPDDMRANMSLFYGTVLLGDEEFELGLEALEEWFSLAQYPLPSQIFSLAYANYQTGNKDRAETLVARAIGESSEPQESWYQLYYRILFEKKKYADAELVLKGMLTRHPSNASYWRMLASHFLQLEESATGLATIMTAYINDLVEEPSDLRQIVSLYGYIDAPEKGARLLDDWIAAGRLEKDAESMKQLGNLWLLARERDEAVTALTEAARMAPDGQVFEMLGGVHFEEESWTAAYDAYREALDLGGLDNQARVELLAGISAFRAGRNDAARVNLEAAARDAEFRAQAQSMLRLLE